jgi:hypothetical protein
MNLIPIIIQQLQLQQLDQLNNFFLQYFQQLGFQFNINFTQQILSKLNGSIEKQIFQLLFTQHEEIRTIVINNLNFYGARFTYVVNINNFVDRKVD